MYKRRVFGLGAAVEPARSESVRSSLIARVFWPSGKIWQRRGSRCALSGVGLGLGVVHIAETTRSFLKRSPGVATSLAPSGAPVPSGTGAFGQRWGGWVGFVFAARCGHVFWRPDRKSPPVLWQVTRPAVAHSRACSQGTVDGLENGGMPSKRGRRSPWEHRAVAGWQHLADATDSTVEQILEVEVTGPKRRPSPSCKAVLVRESSRAERRSGALVWTHQRREGTGRGDAVQLLARGTLRRVCALSGKTSRSRDEHRLSSVSRQPSGWQNSKRGAQVLVSQAETTYPSGCSGSGGGTGR